MKHEFAYLGLHKNNPLYHFKKVNIRDVDFEDTFSIDSDDDVIEEVDSYYTEFYV